MACCAAFHGHITEIPNISVDNFTNLDVKVYFLSHTHTDHTQGLYDHRFFSILKRNEAFIYMSEMSAAIVSYEVKSRSIQNARNAELKGLVERIKVLMLETESIILPEDPQRRLKETELLVTTIPASHCFGSVMFLFRAYSKTVLYTGDFRICCNDVSKFSQLHDKGTPINIDTIYADTTFLHEQYANFPKRSKSVEAAICEIEKWLKKDKRNRVAVKTSAIFGYEYLYNELNKKLACKVYVEDVRWKELYCKVPHLVHGVTNVPSPIHLCWPKNRKDHTQCVPYETAQNHNYLHIHLSAQKWLNFDADDDPINVVSDREIDVCFSTHCSRSELRYFISYFSPKNVVGFPKPYESSPVKRFGDAFCVSPKKAKLGIDRKMDRKSLKEMFDL